ncbi:MAG TPA: DnaJ domain-containing protein [Kineosporiaceae bacterium]
MGLRSADEVARRIADLGFHDAYVLLGVPADASTEQIVQAYRRVMSRAHPDVGGSPERAQLINCAYEVLTRYRGAYDARRGRPHRSEGDDASDAGPSPWRVEPEHLAEDDDQEVPGGRRRRAWFVVFGVVTLVLGVVAGRQLTGVFGSADTAQPEHWTTSRLGSRPVGASTNGTATASGSAGAAASTWSANGAPAAPVGTASGSTAGASKGSAAEGAVAASTDPGGAAAAPLAGPTGVGASPSGSPSVTPPPPGHQCVVRPDTSLWCWGAGGRGELGNGALRDTATPVRVGPPVDRWLTVAAGARTSCALQADAGLWCWGDNSFGQLGDGTTTLRSLPVRVAAGTAWLAVATGTHTCAVRADHTLWCWGAGEHGELGDGTSTRRGVPGQVGAEGSWAAVTVQEARTCAVRQNGTTLCWGAMA